jgi:hypothetical protein
MAEVAEVIPMEDYRECRLTEKLVSKLRKKTLSLLEVPPKSSSLENGLSMISKFVISPWR